jgi:hypothetical protein
MDYFIQWADAYFLHVGIWVSTLVSFHIYKKGLPRLSSIGSIFKSAIVLAAIAAGFSSHAHAHYLSHFSNPLNKIVGNK